MPHLSPETNNRRRVDNVLVIVLIVAAVIIVLWRPTSALLHGQYHERCLDHPDCIRLGVVDMDPFKANHGVWHAMMLR